MKSAEELLRAGMVRRWHTIPGVSQDVAQHSWGVAVLVMLMEPKASANLLRAAILHDVHEIMSGDIPSTTKADNPSIRPIEDKIRAEFLRRNKLEEPYLTDHEKAVLQKADKLEALMFLTEVVNGVQPMAAYNRLKEMLANLGGFE